MATIQWKVIGVFMLTIAVSHARPSLNIDGADAALEDEYDYNLDELNDGESDMDFSSELGYRSSDSFSSRSPSFFSSLKAAAIKAAKVAAHSLAQSGLKALGSKRAVEADALYSQIAEVADEEFEAIGKRMVQHTLEFAVREAGPYGHPGFISAIKSGASRLWNTVKPIAKEIGRKVAGVVANHLNSYASGSRSAEDIQELAQRTSYTVKRAANDLAYATAQAVQDEDYLN
ncbi:uncharacterized protein LOC135829573 isoform X2 [Sycon ciliatum]|uniref:uncharacterized protein LOC135829573 isoform X2 n=1 Tax=Sycon ciliatum TaxID=27933 RepID=UPI0031F607EA